MYLIHTESLKRKRFHRLWTSQLHLLFSWRADATGLLRTHPRLYQYMRNFSELLTQIRLRMFSVLIRILASFRRSNDDMSKIIAELRTIGCLPVSGS